MTHNTRTKVLRQAEKAINKDRQTDYGSPDDSFSAIARLWAAYKNVDFSRADVAAMLALLKIGRVSVNPNHQDSWIDLAGYAACGAEAAIEDKKERK